MRLTLFYQRRTMKLFKLLLVVGLLCLFSSSARAQSTALNFDGDGDYLQLPVSLPLGGISHTVEMWVRVPI